MLSSVGKIAKIVCLICIAFALVGCGEKGGPAPDSRKPKGEIPQVPPVSSMSDLQRLLTPGLGTNEIATRLGKPHRIKDWGGGSVEWRYALSGFPAGPEMGEGTYVVGVTISMTNGHLAHWGCAYYSSGPTTVKEETLPRAKAAGESQTAIQESPRVKLFIVSSDPLPGGRFIDTERFPKLGFIAPTPNLTIGKVKEVALKELMAPGPGNENRRYWSFELFLTRDDGERLTSLTASNISKQVLVTIGDELVVAPRIRSQVDSLAIGCSEQSQMERVKEQLAKMERESQ